MIGKMINVYRVESEGSGLPSKYAIRFENDTSIERSWSKDIEWV